MSDVELLREAARLMRERGGAATAGPWNSTCDAQVLAGYGSSFDGAQLADCFQPDPAGDANAHHIASWHPVVALAVADWLDSVAQRREDRRHDEVSPVRLEDLRLALNVARAYLGTAPERHVAADLSASDIGSGLGDVRDDDSGSAPQNGERP